jgi:hypothetical protein
VLDEHPPPILGVPDATYVSNALQAIDDCGDGASRQVGGPSEVAGGHSPTPVEDLQDAVVGAVHAHPVGDDLVHQVDRARELPARLHGFEK